MAVVPIQDQYAYVFGGMSDYMILNTIEKYDIITDTWISVYFKLPIPLARLAATAISSKVILIMGVMSADFEPQRKNFSLDLPLAKFMEKRPM